MTNSDPMHLSTTGDPCLFAVGCSASELTNLAWELQRKYLKRGVVRVVRGAKMRTTTRLFDEFAASFQFPYYFGENWDALDECLSDLDWLPGDAYLVVVADGLSVLADEPHVELVTFVNMLKRLCNEWSGGRMEGQPWDRPPIPFNVLLHCLEEQGEALGQRYAAAGLEPVVFSLSR